MRIEIGSESDERHAALKVAVRDLRLPNLAIEPFVQGWNESLRSHRKTLGGMSLVDDYTELLDIATKLVNWCDENPPAGESLYFVELARNAVARISRRVGEA